MCSRCQICGPTTGSLEPDLFDQLAYATPRRVLSPGSSPPPGSAHRVAGRELETNQQHAVIGVDDESPHRVADAQPGGRIGRHSSGELLRPSLNMRYMS